VIRLCGTLGEIRLAEDLGLSDDGILSHPLGDPDRKGKVVAAMSVEEQPALGPAPTRAVLL
jgi:hypothetical protein